MLWAVGDGISTRDALLKNYDLVISCDNLETSRDKDD